ncbi:hypothetical protein BV22DRAFT_1045429 [Leucogyrophana mollusca]|uniref:Uncharacterized protein n=1 Tax=Leucogyrophana mollusca TaxID=85980 RepID=A0ACB8BNA2_9AGAM|nr:hypothetical protein BV22DRAFT_1045429 [Leucogyrophana mollusca]
MVALKYFTLTPLALAAAVVAEHTPKNCIAANNHLGYKFTVHDGYNCTGHYKTYSGELWTFEFTRCRCINLPAEFSGKTKSAVFTNGDLTSPFTISLREHAHCHGREIAYSEYSQVFWVDPPKKALDFMSAHAFVIDNSEISAVPGTPRAKTGPVTPAATPSTTRVAGSRPGSLIWKVGFSGEGKARDVFYAEPHNVQSLLSFSRATESTERVEQDRLFETNLERCMLYYTNPKPRMVEVILDTLLKTLLTRDTSIPVDLQKAMASSIGGALMLSGFIIRLHTSFLNLVTPIFTSHLVTLSQPSWRSCQAVNMQHALHLGSDCANVPPSNSVNSPA